MSATPAISAFEQNKHLVIRWFEEVWNQGRREVIHELLAPEGVIHDGGAVIKGPAEFDRFFDALHSEFSDFRISPDLVLAEDDLVSLRWTCTSKHKTSGRSATVTGISIVRVKDGQFIEAWQNWDGRPSGRRRP